MKNRFLLINNRGVDCTEEKTVIDDICPYLTMEDDNDGNGYYFICDKNGTLVNVNNCFGCEIGLQEKNKKIKYL